MFVYNKAKNQQILEKIFQLLIFLYLDIQLLTLVNFEAIENLRIFDL